MENGSAHNHHQLDELEEYLGGSIHGYFTTIICILGIVMNILTLVILSRKPMRTPTNFHLSCIAVADSITTLVFAPETIQASRGEILYTKDAAYYRLVFAHTSLISHTVALWLTVTLCVLRCLVVILQNGQKFNTYLYVTLTVLLTTAITCLLNIPNFLLLHVNKKIVGNKEIYHLDILRSNSTREEQRQAVELRDTQVWIVAVVFKILPCLLLGLMSGLLIHYLWKVQAKYRKMKNIPKNQKSELRKLTAQEPNSSATQQLNRSSGGTKERDKQCTRVTAMLLVVVITTCVVEFPISLLLLLSQVMGKEFFDHYYLKIAPMFNILIVVNSSANFIIYCFMSSQFRQEFIKVMSILFCCCSRKNKHNNKHERMTVIQTIPACD